MAQIRDHDVEHGVERGPAIIDQRKLIDLTVDPICFEIHVSQKDQQQRAHHRDSAAQDQPLSVDLVRAALVHRADLPTVEDARADRNDGGEKGYDTGDGCDRVDGRNARLPDKVTRDDIVAQEHDVDDRHGKGTGQQHGTELMLTKAVMSHIPALDSD